MKKLGIISGSGSLPAALAHEARSQGYRVLAVALEPLADPSLADVVDEIVRVNVGKLGEIIAALKKAGVREVAMAGKVPKSLLYKSRIIPDMRAAKLLFSLKDRSDDSIMLAITRELEKEGLVVLSTASFSSLLLTPEGVLTASQPSAEQREDMEFGWKIAKEIGRLDIGQTIVVKNRAVMAVEAIEGTDEAIRRGGRLAGPGSVVVKVSKPQQDPRFDVPVVGLDTLRAMIEVSASSLAVEAGKSILLERAKFLAEAEKARISVVGFLQRPHRA